jgi:hypothetical protein
VVDSPRLSCILHTTRSYGALLGAACELANVATDYMAGHMVRISVGVMQPVEEMCKAYRIGPLRVDGTIALAQFSQELIA